VGPFSVENIRLRAAARALALAALLAPPLAHAQEQPRPAGATEAPEPEQEEESEAPAPVEFEEIATTAPGHLQLRLTGSDLTDSYLQSWEKGAGVTGWLRATAFLGLTDRSSMSVELPMGVDVRAPHAHIAVAGPSVGGKYQFLRPTAVSPSLVGMAEMELPVLDGGHITLPRATLAAGALWRFQRLTVQGFVGSEFSVEGVEPVAALAVAFNVLGSAHLMWESTTSGPAFSPEMGARLRVTREHFQRLPHTPPWLREAAAEEAEAGGEGPEPLGFTLSTGPTLKWEVLPRLWLGLGTQLGLTPFSHVLRNTMQLEYEL
jgi:hypothetical protein